MKLITRTVQEVVIWDHDLINEILSSSEESKAAPSSWVSENFEVLSLANETPLEDKYLQSSLKMFDDAFDIV